MVHDFLLGDWIALAGYALLSFLFGWWVRGRVVTMRDFTVAAGGVSTAAVFAAMAATFIGPGYTLGFVGKGYEVGLIAAAMFVMFAAKTIFEGVVLAPSMRRYLGAATVGDLMGFHFGTKVRVLTGLLSILYCAGIAAVVSRAAGVTIETFTGVPRVTFSGSAGIGTAPPPLPPPPVPEYRPFPVHALPPVLRDFVTEVAASVDCDPAFAALPALTVAGAAVGSALVVRAKRGYEQPPLLWLLGVGDSGTGKSPAVKPAADRAFCIDRMLRDAYRAAARKFRSDLKAWEESENPDPEQKPIPPVRERFAVIDCTIERLTVECTTSERGLVVVRDEADGWLGSFARYKAKGGGSDVPNWLSMYEAGPVRYLRRTGEPREVEAERAFVAVCGGIQPDILKGVLSDPAFVASGLAARIGFAMPPKACPRWSDRELSDETERAFAGVLDYLRRLPFDPRHGPGRVNLDAVALARFRRLNDEFAQTAEDMDGGPMAAVLPKAVRFALRLALVWHCVSEAAAGRNPGKGSVGEEGMAAGEVLARWFVHEAERVYAVLAERPEDRTARQLLEWVRRRGGRARPRDLQRTNERRYPAAAAAEGALDALVPAGLGEGEDDTPRAGGGWRGRTFVAVPTPSPDTRHSPTLDPDDEDGPPAPPSDTRPPEQEFPAGSGRVSASVGCRTDTPAAQAAACVGAPPGGNPAPGVRRPAPQRGGVRGRSPAGRAGLAGGAGVADRAGGVHPGRGRVRRPARLAEVGGGGVAGGAARRVRYCPHSVMTATVVAPPLATSYPHHYLQTLDADFEKAVRGGAESGAVAVRKAVRSGHRQTGEDGTDGASSAR